MVRSAPASDPQGNRMNEKRRSKLDLKPI